VTQHGALAAGEHRRHPPTFVAEAGVADGVNASMNAMQAGGDDAAVNCTRGETGGAKLRNRNNATLPSGDPGNEGVRIRFVAFCPHVREEGDNRSGFAPFIARLFAQAPDRSPSLPMFVPFTPSRPGYV
jgi:hypothetical protein